jgi:hypothetical protein
VVLWGTKDTMGVLRIPWGTRIAPNGQFRSAVAFKTNPDWDVDVRRCAPNGADTDIVGDLGMGCAGKRTRSQAVETKHSEHASGEI